MVCPHFSPDYILLADLDPRNRPAGETSELIQEGLLRGGFLAINIEIIPDPTTAIDRLFSKAETGDLLVINPDELEPVMNQIMDRYRQMVTQI